MPQPDRPRMVHNPRRGRPHRTVHHTRRLAIGLCAAVRSWNPTEVENTLNQADLPALSVVLAAMIPEGHSPRALLSWIDQDPNAPVELHPTRDINALAARAMVLSAAVRCWNYTHIKAALGPCPDWQGLCVVLAAMVPDDRAVDELLDWTRLRGDARDRGQVWVA